ncbi:uncharacterized protein LOC144143430 [Haemaphysalis longicornis]
MAARQTKGQEGELPRVKEYKYSGVRIKEGNNYLRNHEEQLRVKVKRNAAVMKHRALWGYNKYEVVRGMWKGVMVPGLTFANAVLCLKSDVPSGLEVNQRTVGRLALGAHGKTTNEAVQGDMGWASFEVREAQSKICFEMMLRAMDKRRWAAKVFRYLYLKSVDTQWLRKTRRLMIKYGKNSGECKTAKVPKTEARQIETNKWREKMEAKTSLEMYRAEKMNIRKENFYDNSQGSALLFEARAGCLRTKSFVGKYSQNDGVCVVCGKETETVRHIVLECEGIHPNLHEGNIGLSEALGFKGITEEVTFKTVEGTKRRLECWWTKTREGNIA